MLLSEKGLRCGGKVSTRLHAVSPLPIGCTSIGSKATYSLATSLPLHKQTVAAHAFQKRELNGALDQENEGHPSSDRGAALEHQWQRQQERLQLEDEPSASTAPVQATGVPSPSPHEAYGPIAEAADPRLFFGASVAFVLTTYDIFSPNNSGFLLSIDAAVHQFAAELPHDFRYFWADLIMSDSLIALGLLGWIGCTAAAVASRRRDALVTLFICLGMYAWGAGWPSPPSPDFVAEPLKFDAHICNTVKLFFERVRPAPMNPTWSYPSGHTSSANFLAGTMLFVLLPVLNQQLHASGKENKGVVPRMLIAMEGSWALWFSVCATTAVGRCLADAHWFSDCLGGATLSTAVVSGTAMLVQAALEPLREAQKQEEKQKEEQAQP
ncbi:hypothetical protein DUNSADRAFT_9341 [Dunaliella salina]|uniref:Phosphatidic acid phosphatase type 2/haloperoxidase domain-containing protein n=1 Tax=Dunaliella salina TaxID=3046 RepID=A0ABQ7H5E9_DUNSA|nr:hypothetical protein DUNSADRAFT_9341 [Dunaliella salina]|eukprot:KAF5842082.1 hypothetical protein DUNSADRAFT_9341 [Dunaliella salina]